MKKLLLITCILVLVSLMYAGQVKLMFEKTSEDKQGKKLSAKFEQKMMAAEDFEVVSEIDNGVFFVVLTTADPLADAIIGSELATIYSLDIVYFYDGLPVYINSVFGYTIEANLNKYASDIYDMMVDSIGKAFINYPQLRNEG